MRDGTVRDGPAPGVPVSETPPPRLDRRPDYLQDDPNMVSWAPNTITLEGLRIDPGDVVQFLARLAVCGNVADACKLSRISRATVYRMRAAIPEFRDAWDRALSNARDVLEREAWRRAVEGVVKPVVHAGKVIGAVREYSDRLLALMLQARHPDYARTVGRVEVNQTQQQGITMEVGPEAPPLADTVDPVTGRTRQGLLGGIVKLHELADPRGAVLLVRFPGETEAQSV